MSQEPLVEVPVVKQYAICAYPMCEDAIAASDNCGKPATSAVEVAGGSRNYRCEGHRGLIRGSEQGKVFETVLQRPKR